MNYNRYYKKIIPLVFIFPAVIILLAVWGYPISNLFYISSLDWHFTSPQNIKFVGLKNFINLSKDSYFINSIYVTLIYVLLTVSLQLILGLFISTRLHNIKRGKTIFITIFLIPMIMSPVVVALFWRAWLTPQFGLIPYFFDVIGLGSVLPPEGVTASYQLALPILILIDVWEWTPFMILVLYSGLQTLPKEPFEALEVDGGTKTQAFLYLTLPMLKSIIGVGLLFRIIDSYRAFDLIWIITRGGPGRATENLSVFTYKTGLREWNIGYSSASGIFMLLGAIIIASILINRIMKDEKIQNQIKK